MDRQRILRDAIAQPRDAIRRALTTGLRAADPEFTVVEAHDLYGDLFRFSAKGHATFRRMPGFDSDVRKAVKNDRLTSGPQTAWWEIEWNGASLEMIEIQLTDGFRRAPYVVLAGKSPDAIDAFILALHRFASEIEGAVLVFQDGCWRYDETLYEDIRHSTFDNLILPTGLAESIRSDVRGWLGAKALYEEHGVPWKRGFVLVGPPGNGKTHLVKALVNEFEMSALYVRGFTAEHRTDAQNISAIFERARACAPALLIFEDVDTLVNAGNRSHFLNELDGFARNTGILAVATANDPAKLDPALVNRPSRFDRRYVFELPGEDERRRYLAFFTARLEPSLRLGDGPSAEIAALAEGFSYAYLKELVLSSMMAWISAGGTESFVGVLRRELIPLSAQMTIDPEPTPPPPPDPAPRSPYRRR